MPRTILPRRNRRCALSATGTRKPEEKDARGVTYFMEENVISPREVARFNELIRNEVEKQGRAVFCLCLIDEHPAVYFAC